VRQQAICAKASRWSTVRKRIAITSRASLTCEQATLGDLNDPLASVECCHGPIPIPSCIDSASVCRYFGTGMFDGGSICDFGSCLVAQVADPQGIENVNVAPGPSFATAHSRPPWASIIERLSGSPIPIPSGLVV
jgi:hypothetical protein